MVEAVEGAVGEPAIDELDTADLDCDRDLGQPGEFPYTRGVQPNMYRGRLWTMRQYAGFGTASESNQRYRYLLSQGVSGLSVAFDLPTQIGYDSDHPMARDEIGQIGVALTSLAQPGVQFCAPEQARARAVASSQPVSQPAPERPAVPGRRLQQA